MRTIVRLFVFISMTLGLGLTAIAQTTSGQIAGRVVDPSGAAVPDAAVTLTNQETSDARTATTEASGEFVFPAVQPGIFTVAVSAPGFKKYEKHNLTLHASERLAAGSLQLEIGAVNESVNVQADQTPIQIDSSEHSAVVDSKELSTLMTSNRDVTQLLRVLPGVVKSSGPGGQFGGSQNAGNVNGVRGDSNSLSVDGTTGNVRGGANFDTPANYDSVGEVKVLLNNYQAEYGQAAGAIVELVTKSGTRDFHGSVYYYNRNEAYNANSYFNKRTNPVTPRAVSRYNTIGYNIGGPVFIPHLFNTHKDKMFFFWSQEIWPSTTPGDLKYWMMPTALEKQGDFSNSFDKSGNKVRIADPQLIAAGKTCSATVSTGCFPNAVIPASRINADMQKLLAILPTGNATYLGTQSSARYNYTTQSPVKRPVNQQVLRVDYNISPKWHAYFRGAHTTTAQDGAAVASVTGAMQWGTPFVYSTPGKTAGLNLTFIPNPTLINEFNLGFAQWSESSRFSNSSDLAKFQRDKLGMALGQYNPQINPLNLVPRASWGGSSGFAIGNAPQLQFDNRFPLANDARSWQVQDSITKVWNRHTSKAGFYFQNGVYLQRHIGGNFNGEFSFATSGTSTDTGYAYANSLLGQYNSYTEGSNTVNYAPRSNIIEWFVQDSWKIIPRLTLDYGIRFTYDIPTTLLPNQGAGFVASRYNSSKVPRLYQPYKSGTTRYAIDPGASGAPGSATNPLLPNVYIGQFVPNSGDYSNGVVVNTDPSFPRSLRDSNGLLVAPRLGFAYDVFGNGKTAVRGGAGLFYNTREGGGTVGDYSLIAPLVYNPVQNYGDAKQFAGNCSGTACSSGTTLISPQQTRILQRNRPIETMFNATLGVQQAIGFQTVVDVAYVGTFGRHLSEQIDLNEVPYLSQFNNCDNTQNKNTYLAGTSQSITQCVALNDNFFRPTPGFTNVNLRSYSGTSNYHSLQTQLTRRFAKGLQFGVAYTYSKVMTDMDTVNGSVATYQARRWWNYGLANFDRTNVFVAHWSWDLPKGSTYWSNFATRTVLDNWQLSGIAEFSTGAPLLSPWTQGSSSTVGASKGNQMTTGGVNLTGGGDGARPLLISNPILPKSKRSVNQFFDTSAFAPITSLVGVVPSASNTPNMLRSTFGRGPGTNYFDMAVNKNFPLPRERMLFQLRLEAYNVFNHASFTTVDTNPTFSASTGAQTSTTFGMINGERGARQLQISGRFNF